jgi:hypothetical protein
MISLAADRRFMIQYFGGRPAGRYLLPLITAPSLYCFHHPPQAFFQKKVFPETMSQGSV